MLSKSEMRRSQNATASSRPSRCRRESWCTCSERTPGVISMIPGSFSSRNCCSNPCTRKRRSEERRVGKECRARRGTYHEKKKKNDEETSRRNLHSRQRQPAAQIDH